MPASASSTESQADEIARVMLDQNPWRQRTPRSFLQRGSNVALVAVLVAVVFQMTSGAPTFWVSLVYAELVSLASWACIDFGRFAFREGRSQGWPTGWRGIALPVVGCVLGYIIGHSLGDWVFGWSSWAAYRSGQRNPYKDLFFSALIGFLFSLFYYLRGRAAFHKAQVALAERDATLAKLGMLQSQLEPHMLFNTLANLRVLIGTDPPQAQAMLDRLIAFLRATLGASRVMSHPLRDEFERLNDYLALMAVRMGPRLAYTLDLPADLAGVAVPPLLLQPLVENAIKHGLEPAVDGGRIDVQARREGARLQLTVRDTGLGIGNSPASDGSGFGLTQIRERLATLFGADASLTLTPAPDAMRGTVARIELPLTLPSPT